MSAFEEGADFARPDHWLILNWKTCYSLMASADNWLLSKTCKNKGFGQGHS